jgi:hypothetical protein
VLYVTGCSIGEGLADPSVEEGLQKTEFVYVLKNENFADSVCKT